MQTGYKLDNGTTIISSLGRGEEWHICIPEKSDIWTQPFNWLKSVLDETKTLLPYAKELRNIDISLGLDLEESFCVKHNTICQVEKVLSELKNVEHNPLADKGLRQLTRNILKQYTQYQAKKVLQRNTPSTIRRKVILRDNSTCRYCGKKLEKKEIHIDHVIPYSLGGRTEADNLVVACIKCNLKKSGLTLKEANINIINI